MSSRRLVIVGGGAAGFFAAITCAEALPGAEVVVLEKGQQFLAKVRISGGGRCNVTHACFDPRDLAAHYPRGGQALRGPFHSFQPRDTIAWFERRGVKLKTQPDGCLFPVTDSSQTIMDCFLDAARQAGVTLRAGCGVERVGGRAEGGFELTLADGETLTCDRLLLATGGCRVPALGRLAISLGHTLEPPVPSLFTFNLETPWVRELAGVVLDSVEVSVPGHGLRERGTVLFTHWGAERPGHSAALRVGRANFARIELPVSAAPELVAHSGRGSNRGATPSPSASAIGALGSQQPDPAAHRAIVGKAGAGGGPLAGTALGRTLAHCPTSTCAATHPNRTDRQRQESEQGRIRHLRRGAVERGQFQDDGKPARTRSLLRGRTYRR